ncbi:aspartate/glutamate racemase family protein [Desulfofundulus sp.]|uniref:aspartate/glutamate racemase family protein n=1 Tax=Desulfofundulus sp. TaxID=2282750 RepID=UPI003C7182BC
MVYPDYAFVNYFCWHHPLKIAKNRKILVLATTATIRFGIYQQVFKNYGIELLNPTDQEQELVAATIDQVKAGRLADNPYLVDLDAMLEQYVHRGIKACIGACTEIPLLFPYLRAQLEKIDPTLLLARMAVREAMK